MCLAIPGKVTEINGDTVTLNYGEVSAVASSALIENIEIGDIVIVHAGFVIQKVDEKYYDEYRSITEFTDEH